MRDSKQITLKPENITQLTGSGGQDWLWEGYLSPGNVTLLTGIWKGGKSTLLGHLFKLFGTGGEIGTAIHKAKVLILSDDSRSKWAQRRDEIGIGDNVDVLSRPFMQRPTFDQWYAILQELARLITSEKYGIVVLDPISSLWPVFKENDAGQVMSALMPLHMLTRAGAAVLLCHHPRKSDGTEGQASRGSGALPGFVDVIIEFRRMKAEDRGDTRRVLTTYSRFDESPDEVVIDLQPQGYVGVGTKHDASRSDRLRVIADLVPESSPGITIKEIRSGWDESTVPCPGLRCLQLDLSAAHQDGKLGRSGTGKRNDPYRFWADNSNRARSPSIGARFETESIDPTQYAGATEWVEPVSDE